MSKNTNVYARKAPRTHQCYFSWKCKDRGDLVLSMGKNGRTPHDIYLCEDHAKNMITALLEHFGMSQDLGEMINKSNEIISQSLQLINRSFDEKSGRITFGLVEDLLKAKGYSNEELKGLKFKGTQEAINMLMGFDTRAFTEAELKAIETSDLMAEKAEELEAEMEDFDPGLSDEEIDFITEIEEVELPDDEIKEDAFVDVDDIEKDKEPVDEELLKALEEAANE